MASNRNTPVTKTGLEQYDHLPAAEAVVAALVNPGQHLEFHKAKLSELSRNMPVLYRALVRLAKEQRND